MCDHVVRNIVRYDHVAPCVVLCDGKLMRSERQWSISPFSISPLVKELNIMVCRILRCVEKGMQMTETLKRKDENSNARSRVRKFVVRREQVSQH